MLMDCHIHGCIEAEWFRCSANCNEGHYEDEWDGGEARICDHCNGEGGYFLCEKCNEGVEK